MKLFLTLLTTFSFTYLYTTAKATNQNLVFSQDIVCPESVKQVRLLMASTYNTCDAIDHVFNMEKINERRESLREDGSSTNRLDKTCKYSHGQNCADISNYDLAVETHTYNSLFFENENKNKCDEIGNRCMIDGELRICPTFYYMGITEELLVTPPYVGEDKEFIDPAGTNYRSRDINGNEFVGWDCSRYLATAMRLAGFKMICDNKDIVDSGGAQMTATNGWTVQRMSEAADHHGDCSCMDTVDLSNPNEHIKPGDILLYDGHAMMIEATARDFMGELTNPTLSEQDCSTNENECLAEIEKICSEENVEPNDLQFVINHSDDVLGGIGPTIMNYADYRVFSGVRSDNWYAEREHISNLCKARLCKKYNLIENQACKYADEFANIRQSNIENRFFKIIRHNSLKDSCVDQTPPRLLNSCGDRCNTKVYNKSCLYSGG